MCNGLDQLTHESKPSDWVSLSFSQVHCTSHIRQLTFDNRETLRRRVRDSPLSRSSLPQRELRFLIDFRFNPGAEELLEVPFLDEPIHNAVVNDSPNIEI